MAYYSLHANTKIIADFESFANRANLLDLVNSYKDKYFTNFFNEFYYKIHDDFNFRIELDTIRLNQTNKEGIQVYNILESLNKNFIKHCHYLYMQQYNKENRVTEVMQSDDYLSNYFLNTSVDWGDLNKTDVGNGYSKTYDGSNLPQNNLICMSDIYGMDAPNDNIYKDIYFNSENYRMGIIRPIRKFPRRYDEYDVEGLEGRAREFTQEIRPAKEPNRSYYRYYRNQKN